MGFLDKLKDKAKEAKDKAAVVVDEHSPQIKQGIHKAGDFVDKKTHGKYSDKIAKGTEQAGGYVDKMHASDDSDPSGAPGASNPDDPTTPDSPASPSGTL